MEYDRSKHSQVMEGEPLEYFNAPFWGRQRWRLA